MSDALLNELLAGLSDISLPEAMATGCVDLVIASLNSIGVRFHWAPPCADDEDAPLPGLHVAVESLSPSFLCMAVVDALDTLVSWWDRLETHVAYMAAAVYGEMPTGRLYPVNYL